MSTRQYIGARYVPTVEGAWNINRPYENLSVVTYLGNSYTSKKPVPTGVSITNEEYWVNTGNFNQQVEIYRQMTEAVANDLNGKIIVFESEFDELIDDNKGAKKKIKGGAFAEAGITPQNSVILGVSAFNHISNTWWNNDDYPMKCTHLKEFHATIQTPSISGGGTYEYHITNAPSNVVGCEVKWTYGNTFTADYIDKPGSELVLITNTYSGALQDRGELTLYYIDDDPNYTVDYNPIEVISAKLRIDTASDYQPYLQVISVLPQQYTVGDKFRVVIYKFNNVITV